MLPTVDPQLGALVHAELAAHGVEVLTGTTVQAVSKALPGGSGRLEVQATTADGSAVTRAADMVLVVVGVRPETTLAAGAGMDLILCSQRDVSEGEQAAAGLADGYRDGQLGQPAYLAALQRVLALRASLGS